MSRFNSQSSFYLYIVKKEKSFYIDFATPLTNNEIYNIKYEVDVTESMFIIPNLNSPFQKKIDCQLKNCRCRLNPFIWISHDLKAIYYEVPKSASSSIRHAISAFPPDLFYIIHQFLLESFKVDKFSIKLNLKAKNKIPLIKRIKEIATSAVLNFNLNLVEFSNQTILKSDYSANYRKESTFEPLYLQKEKVFSHFPNYFSFTFIRNPFSRVLSNWHMFTQQKKQMEKLSIIFNKDSKLVSFPEFIEKLPTNHNHHWNPQINYLPHLDNEIKVDFIGKLESINKDWKFIKNKLNLENDLIVKNTTQKELTSFQTLDKNLDLLIKDFYKEDFILFG